MSAPGQDLSAKIDPVDAADQAVGVPADGLPTDELPIDDDAAGTPIAGRALELPLEADPADAVEQTAGVGLDEDERR